MSTERPNAPLFACLAIAAAAIALCIPAAAQADYGLSEFDVTFTGPEGETVSQAGSHPFAMNIPLHFVSEDTGEGGERTDEAAKDVITAQMPGFVGNPTAVPTCSTADFLSRAIVEPKSGGESYVPDCPDASAVGTAGAGITVSSVQHVYYGAIYNLDPPPGVASKLGWWITGVPVTIELGAEEDSPYRILGGATNISQVLEVISSELILWGNPAAEPHDELRGHCLDPVEGISLGECSADTSETPFLTLPRSCEGPQRSEYATDSWQHPGARLPNGHPDLTDPNWITGFSETHDEAGEPLGMSGCGKLGFGPEISAQPTSRAAESSSGLDFSLDVNHNEGLLNPDGVSDADIAKAVVTLPVGMTANPSSANGLETCSEAQLAAETPWLAPGEGPTYTQPGAGCPDASKLGTIEAETPVLEGRLLKGSLFLAKPYENPFGTLLALYMVIREPGLGLVFKLPLKVEPDPDTGQLVTTSEDIPPYPISHFRLHFREGARSPLVTPPGCGTYTVQSMLYPSTGGAPVPANSSFEIIAGPGGGACPSGDEPFNPGFEAGTENNAAGSYSPFSMRLTRQDGDQDLTRFSAKLPPGVVGRLAGTAQCSAAAIAQARSRTGQRGGEEEKNNPSCPSDSQIGHVLAGAGVGSILTYVPGNLYLAGPYNGAPLSVVAIVPALAGPFDAGTVVTQEALRINPLTAEVEADGSSSDPIPHILKGIPLKVRDIRVYVDKPDFTLNPTSCEESATEATLWSGGQNVFSTLDDAEHSLQARFQAASCASLGFKPKLALTLRGSTPKRGGHPALRGVFTPRKGDANLRRLVLRLPHSAFLDQAHIRTICTRVQFAANGGNGGGCPKAAIYGHAKAWTPLLDEPLSGPVYLRSSNHNLPDFVAALHGTIDVEAVARIDSKKGGIRATFPTIPDAPLSRVIVNMQGGKKGLIVNSKNLCYRPGRNRANARYFAHNGRRATGKPVLRALKCKKRHAKKHKRHRRQ